MARQNYALRCGHHGIKLASKPVRVAGRGPRLGRVSCWRSWNPAETWANVVETTTAVDMIAVFSNPSDAMVAALSDLVIQCQTNAPHEFRGLKVTRWFDLHSAEPYQPNRQRSCRTREALAFEPPSPSLAKDAQHAYSNCFDDRGNAYCRYCARYHVV